MRRNKLIALLPIIYITLSSEVNIIRVVWDRESLPFSVTNLKTKNTIVSMATCCLYTIDTLLYFFVI